MVKGDNTHTHTHNHNYYNYMKEPEINVCIFGP